VAAGWLVDTNVISELRRRSPDVNVQAWFAQRPATELYLSVLTLGEIRKGVEALADSGRRTVLREWLERELPVFFAERVLPIDAGVAHQWGQLQAEAGRSLPAIDSLLAATALHHNLVLVTRNLKDMAGPVSAGHESVCRTSLRSMPLGRAASRFWPTSLILNRRNYRSLGAAFPASRRPIAANSAVLKTFGQGHVCALRNSLRFAKLSGCFLVVPASRVGLVACGVWSVSLRQGSDRIGLRFSDANWA
jgi:predicted nucleic acid-binding protein